MTTITKSFAVSLKTMLLLSGSYIVPSQQHGSVESDLPPRHPAHNSWRRKELFQNQNDNPIPIFDKDTTSFSEILRNDLLEKYDKGTYPWEHAWNVAIAKKNDTMNDGSDLREGLPIEIGLNFHKIFDVDVEKSVVDVVAWIRLQWNDPRLAWDPEDYNNMTNTWFWIGGEETEIWTPDVHLWNLESELSDTFVDTHGMVSSDGTVFWSRPGHLKPVCKFTGLEDFPFDSLQCTMEFGSWVHSGLYLRPVKLGDGYSLGGSDTAGEAFAAFSLKSVLAEEKVYPPFPSSPAEDWPVLLYHVTLKRAWQPYVRGFVVLQILLNLTAFLCLWFPVNAGERMGLAITSVLAAVASDLVVASKLPMTSDITWFARFSVGSMIFAFSIIFETAVVIHFYYNVEDDLKPTWFRWVYSKINSRYVFPSDTAKRQSTRTIALDAEDFRSTREKENNLKWQAVARNIDEGSQVLIPAAYAIFLAVMFMEANKLSKD